MSMEGTSHFCTSLLVGFNLMTEDMVNLGSVVVAQHTVDSNIPYFSGSLPAKIIRMALLL